MEKVGTRTTGRRCPSSSSSSTSLSPLISRSTRYVPRSANNTKSGGCQSVVVAGSIRNSTRGGLISPARQGPACPYVGTGSPTARIAGPANAGPPNTFRGCKLPCIHHGWTNSARHGFNRASTSACDADLPGVAQAATHTVVGPASGRPPAVGTSSRSFVSWQTFVHHSTVHPASSGQEEPTATDEGTSPHWKRLAAYGAIWTPRRRLQNRSTFCPPGLASDLTCGAPFRNLGFWSAPVFNSRPPPTDCAVLVTDAYYVPKRQRHDIQAPGSMGTLEGPSSSLAAEGNVPQPVRVKGKYSAARKGHGVVRAAHILGNVWYNTNTNFCRRRHPPPWHTRTHKARWDDLAELPCHVTTCSPMSREIFPRG